MWMSGEEIWNWYVILITDGELDYSFGGKDIHIGKGLILFDSAKYLSGFPKNSQLSGLILSVPAVSVMRMGITDDLFFCSAIEQMPFTELDDKEFKHISKYFQLIRHALEKRSNHYSDEELHFLCKALLINCKNYFNISPACSGKSSKARTVSRFIKLVSEKSREERSATYYAKELSIAPKYLSALISSNTGKTVSQWITEFAIDQAKYFLSESVLSVNEISDRMNFITSSDFTKYFKRHTGMSPKMYRKLILEADHEISDVAP